MEVFTHLDWDSAFFGFPIASVRFTDNINPDRILNTLQKKKYRLVYLFVPQDSEKPENKILIKYGGILVDRKITYRHKSFDLQNGKTSSNIRINAYSTGNEYLIQLAIIAGEFSRFKTDPNIDSKQFEQLYTEWITKSVSGILADFVITYHVNDKPVGLVTLSIKGKNGHIGLISVSDRIQNSGIGSHLINEVFATCDRKGIKTIEVITQEDNKRACRFYEKNGFVKHKFEYVYHFWLKKI